MQRIALDIGGTKIASMLTGDNPLDIITRERKLHDKNAPYQEVLATVAAAVQKLQAQATDDVAVGIGMPGSVSTITGLIRNCNIAHLNGMPFQRDLEEKLGLRVHIENDANCMTLSEAIFGSGKDHRVVAGVIMGTGLGGGLVIDKKIYTGKQGYAGEWGHSTLDMNGHTCWCGRKGCLEQYISGTGYQRLYTEISQKHASVQEIQALWQNKDSQAVQATNQFLDCFSQAMRNIIFMLDPDIIVIGGGVSKIPILYNEGLESVKQLFSENMSIHIAQSKMGDDSGIYGAALIAGSI